jgi:putative hydrolase of the HAD superfamily
MSFTTLFFDLDATLYAPQNGLWDEIRIRIFQYMQEVVGIPKDQVPETRDRYWKTYGTTLEGLRRHHQVDPDDYLTYVHNIPLDQYLADDPQLRNLLKSLPQDLWVFTNADHRHASAVLHKLGIFDLFQGIVDLIAMDFRIKPQPESYRIALKMAGGADPVKSILFDDLQANLAGAKSAGMTTVLVGENKPSDQFDFRLASIYDIKEKLPMLWNHQSG